MPKRQNPNSNQNPNPRNKRRRVEVEESEEPDNSSDETFVLTSNSDTSDLSDFIVDDDDIEGADDGNDGNDGDDGEEEEDIAFEEKDDLEDDYEYFATLPTISAEQLEQLRVIIDYLKSKEISVMSILNSDLSVKKKARLFQRYKLYEEETNPFIKKILGNSISASLEQASNKIDIDSEKKEEWKKIKSLNSGNKIPLKDRIINSGLSLKNKAELYKMYKEIEMCNEESSDYAKKLQWMEWALSLPTNEVHLPIGINSNNEEKNNFLTNAQNLLDQDLFGMHEIKMELLMILMNKVTGCNAEKILALNGAPGTGKTMIAKSLADATGLPFARIALGGANDVSYLDGHGYTYIGSIPGMIVQELVRMKFTNGIIFLDELDKLANSDKAAEVVSLLLHVLDPSQNTDFHDKYLHGLSIDLSKVWFIVAMNDSSKVNHILRDRLRIINIKSYTISDKVHILREYFMPTMLERFALNGKVEISDDICQYIVEKSHSGNSGVRKLRGDIETIINKIKLYHDIVLSDGSIGNLKLDYTLPNFQVPYTITKEVVDSLLKDDMSKCISESLKMMYI